MRIKNSLFFFLLSFAVFAVKPAFAQMLTGFGDSLPVEEEEEEAPATDSSLSSVSTPRPLHEVMSNNEAYAHAPLTAVGAYDGGDEDEVSPQSYEPSHIYDEQLVEREVTALQPVYENVDLPVEEDGTVVQLPAVRPLTKETLAQSPVSAPALSKGDNAPVDLIADNLQHEDNGNVVTASGNVMLEQSGRILRADEVKYYLDQDRVVARGNVVLNEPTGDIYLADEVEFTEQLKNGFVDSLKAYLADGARMTADSGERVEGNETIAYDASYTPCEPCKAHPEKAPVWQIRASKVTHNKEEAKIEYKNATFDVYGVPVAYTPYFAHSDGSVKQKSGFVSPTMGFDSTLGMSAGLDYYWAIAPDKDATIGVTYFADENPMLRGEWRQRWDNASLKINGSTTYSDRTDTTAGNTVHIDDEWRGHVFANALWDIDNQWRAGVDVQHASDDQYLRQYNLSSEDVLQSQVYLERFSGRNYGVGRLLKFQDVRVRDEQEDQPEVIPEVIAGFVGDPGAVPLVGGRWDLETSFLGLRRDGGGRDLNRMSVDAGWERRLVSDTGLLTELDASVRADAYNVRDRDALDYAGADDHSTETRVFPQMDIQTSYPMVKPMERAQLMIEPKASLTLAPNMDANDAIPNEDSQDVQIDASNLFEANRFPGLDRVEDNSHVTYGVRTGIYGYDGSHFDVFAGQSMRLEDKGNPFPEGSGLNAQESDYVGEVTARYMGNNRLNYRFQLDSTNFYSKRHELYSYNDFGRMSVSTRYLYASALEDTDIDESREQVAGDIGFYFTEEWHGRFGATQDLGQDPGLRYAYAGLDFFGQCVSWSLDAERSLTDDASGDSEMEFMFRIGLKNLGEYQSSSWLQRKTAAGND